jgi:hypothetical protein
LKANEGLSFEGSKVNGIGFVVSAGEAQVLIETEPANRDVLFRYVNGEDLNSRPHQSPSRWVINFWDWPRERAEAYAACWEIVNARVRPERERRRPDGEFALPASLRERFWRYDRWRPALYAAIAGMNRVLVRARVSSTNCPAFLNTGIVFSDATTVFASDSSAFLAIIQSGFHTAWLEKQASSLETRIRYTPSDCFDTFAFPESIASLEAIGEEYHGLRRGICLDLNLGLTKVYNRFNDIRERDPRVDRLRGLHVELDRAVAEVYGWSDLDLGHDFHRTDRGLRFTIAEPARLEILDRLLALNHERHREEQEGLIRDPFPQPAGSCGS